MLVLSRERDEEIIIRHKDVEISVCVVDIRGDKVRLGVTAPKGVSINRKEVQNQIDQEAKEQRDGKAKAQAQAQT